MVESIYLVDPVSKQPVAVQPVSFAQIGVKERSDLQEWILAHPRILGEELLVITSEFDRFDRSNNRLDILALDKNGVLAIVELKLDASRSLADLQALRYAAFCSAMTMDDAVIHLSKWRGLPIDDAADMIVSFLNADELPELAAQPRIILAAGAIDDIELTSTVLWLRNFRVDISCLEITPYRLPGSDQIMLVPRILIPLPEAREYVVGLEGKESARNQKDKIEGRDQAALREVAAAFNTLGIEGFIAKAHKHYTQIYIPGQPWNLHYEFWHSGGIYSVGLHAEFKDRVINLNCLQPVFDRWDEITAEFGFVSQAGPWRRNWAHAYLTLPPDGASSSVSAAQLAATTMKRFIEATHPLLASAGRTDEEPAE